MSGLVQERMTGIKYISLHERSGYGIAAKRYILGLRNYGVPITWTPMRRGRRCYEPYTGTEIDDLELKPLCNRSIPYETVIIHTVPEYYPYWAEKEKGKRIIGYTVWETDKLPSHWPPILNRLDRLFVPCRWNQEVFRQSGVTRPVDVVPHIAEVRRPSGRSLPGKVNPGDFVFYCISTWTARKSIWNTVRCYLDTFTGRDPTVLIIKTSRRDFTRHYFRRFFRSTRRSLREIRNRYPDPARICLLDGDLTDEEMLQLHQRGDCYISLCRSEGWGLGAFDAAAAGKPVIMTGYGGQMDYLSPQNSYIVPHEVIAVQDPSPYAASYTRDQNWGEPNLEAASRFMKHVFTHRQEAAEKGKELGNFVLDQFQEKVISQKIISAISG